MVVKASAKEASLLVGGKEVTDGPFLSLLGKVGGERLAIVGPLF